MPTTSDASNGCRGFFAEPKQYPISERQVFLIESAVDWIIEQVENNSNIDCFSPELNIFRECVTNFLRDRFQELGCANLRTTSYNTQLYMLAAKAGISCNALPKNVSIIINKEMCYYLKGDSARMNIIASY